MTENQGKKKHLSIRTTIALADTWYKVWELIKDNYDVPAIIRHSVGHL